VSFDVVDRLAHGKKQESPPATERLTSPTGDD